MSQYSEEEQVRLTKKGRCFSYREKGYIHAYNYSKKEKIAAISEGISENSNSQGKD